jgi:hypothetical protein
MKCPKFTVIIMLFLLSTVGCSTLKHGQHIASIDMSPDAKLEFSGVQALSDIERTAAVSANSRLIQAAMELDLIDGSQLSELGIDTNLVRSSAAVGEIRAHRSLFPTWLRNSDVARKIVADQIVEIPEGLVSVSQKSGKPTPAKKHDYSTKELTDFSLTLLKRSGFFGEYSKDDNMSTLKSLNSTSDQDRSIYDHRLLYYLAAYFEGEYVDRGGQVFAKPKLSTTLGNDTIVPLVLVALDAFYDSFNDMPVFYTDAAFTKPVAGEKEPTPAQFETKILKIDPSRIKKHVINPLNVDGTPNENWDAHPHKLITTNEALIIKLLTGIGGEQSKHLSGLLVKTLGDMQVGAVVVAGHLSIGDNETLVKIIEATVQQISRRGRRENVIRSIPVGRRRQSEVS